jgi:hypothetical protein
MAQSPSVEPAIPELDALEAFLGSTPEELVAFTETPFGALLAKVNELGFDGDVIQAELAITGILDAEAWTSAVGVDLAGFLALTPLEYADRYPEHGAPLVAAILNSIHLSEEQASLHSVAGGSNLSKGEKIGIGVGVAAFTGLYLVPRIYKTNKLRNKLLELTQLQGDIGAAAAEKGFETEYGRVNLTTDFLGINHVNIHANSFKSRLCLEWNSSLLGHIHKFKPPAPPEPDRSSVAISDVESVIQSDGSQEISSSIRSSVRSDVPGLLQDNELIDNNLERSFIDPFREVDDLSRDLRGAANAGLRPKSMEVVMNNELDSMAVADLKRAAKSEMDTLDFDGLSQRFETAESNLLSTEKAALRNEFDGIETSVKSNLNDDIEIGKNDVTAAINKEVSSDEIIVKDAAQAEESKIDQAFAADAKATVAAVETKAENAINNAESLA